MKSDIHRKPDLRSLVPKARNKTIKSDLERKIEKVIRHLDIWRG